MMRLFQTLSIIAVALTCSLTCSEANLRATIAEQHDVDEVDVPLDNQEVRRLSAGYSGSTEDDDYAPDSGSMGMGKGGKGTYS
jgi:hypothetical protein